MPGSNVPETVPLFLLRLTEDEYDLLCRWIAEVMQIANIHKPIRLQVMGILGEVEHAIAGRRVEAPIS